MNLDCEVTRDHWAAHEERARADHDRHSRVE
jgi:hypothetical protein